MSCPKLSVIIAVYNRADLTVKCLESLKRNTVYDNWELIIVDNGSTDTTPELLKKWAGEAKVLTAESNLGFARGNNLGAEAAQGEMLCFLNNDTEVMEGWLTALVNCMQKHPGAMAVGGKLLFPDGAIQHAGVVFDKIDKIGYHVYRGMTDNSPFVNRERKVKAVTAACMLVKQRAFAEAGGFDEGYINGFEDIDLCLKLGMFNGEIYYTPRCRVIHHTSATPGRGAHDEHNSALFQRKWFDKIQADEDLFLTEDGFRAEWEGVNCTLKQIWCDIIIPVEDTVRIQKTCDSILQNTQFPNHRIILVGDKVDIDWYQKMKTAGKRVVKIPAYGEFNCGIWWNMGAAGSNADYLLFLQDCIEVSPGWLTELIRSVVGSSAEAAGAKILFQDGTIYHAGIVFAEKSGKGSYIYQGCPREAIYVNREREYQAVGGGCLLVKRNAFLEAGKFKEEYKGEYAGIDLCIRISAGKKGKIRYSPQSRVIYTGEKKEDITSDNDDFALFSAKWKGKYKLDEGEYYAADGFGIVEHEGSTRLKYMRDCAAIIVIYKLGVNFAVWVQNLIYNTVYPDFKLYFIEGRGWQPPKAFNGVVGMIEGDGILQAARKLKEKVVCAVEMGAEMEKGWLSKLVLWGESVGGGELIIESEPVWGKGYPQLERTVVEQIRYFRMQ